MSETSARLKWSNEEWLRVAINMLPFLAQGLPRASALQKAQKHCLPSDRHRDKASITHSAAPSGLALNKYLEKARALSEEELATKTVPMPERKKMAPRKKLDEGRDYPGNVRWTTIERSKIVRMVDWFKAHGVTSSLGRMFVEAQELVLPTERRRAVKGIMQGNGNGLNQRAYEDGQNNLWLITDVPFNPPQPPGAEPAASEQAQEATETAIPGDETAAAYLPPPPPLVALGHAPAGTLREAMAGAAQAFGATVMGALDTLLMTHSALIIHSIESRLSDQASATAKHLATLLEASMRDSVRAIMEHELGGPVTPPTAAPAEPAPAPPKSEPVAQAPAPATPVAKSRMLKVDVVGMNNGREEQLIRDGFTGEIDLRFFSPDSVATYAPHRGRECIMVTQRVPHTLKFKIKAAGIEPLYVKPTTGHVVHAIEELMRAHGVAQLAHSH